MHFTNSYPIKQAVYQDIMNGHTKKVARMLSREMDVDEHIQSISSYKLSFFQKLILFKALQRSIALNYIERKGPSPPKSLQRALNQLKQRDDIVITKPDKGTGMSS